MLEIRNISKSFEDIKAIDDFSLNFEKGKITIISGADGAGKSTIFKIILGLIKPDNGKIMLNGKDIEGNYSKITNICGYMPEKFSLYEDLTVEENINFFSDIREVPIERRESLKKTLLENTGMLRFKNRRAGKLSGGMKQKLSLATILLSNPQIIILDEPTTGVDPLSRIEFFEIIEDLKNEGKTIIISTPYLDEAEKGDNIVFLKDGKKLKYDSIDNFRKNIPFKIYSIIPDGNIFDIVQRLRENEEYKNKVYIKGRFIKYIEENPNKTPDFSIFDKKSVLEDIPSLEDIYLYYDKIYEKNNR